MRSSVGTALLLLSLLLLSLLLPRVASAQLAYCQSLAGTTTVIDPPNASSAFFRGVHLEFQPAATWPGQIIGRQPFNLPAFDPNRLYTPLVKARFLDNGSEGRVQVILKRTDFQGGAAESLVSFDSNSYLASSQYQTSAWNPPPYLCQAYDPLEHLYFLHVQLDKTGAGGTPILHSIQVCMLECP